MYIVNLNILKILEFYILPSLQKVCPQTLESTLHFEEKRIALSHFDFSLPCRLFRCVVPP